VIDANTYPLPRKRRLGPPSAVDIQTASTGATGTGPPRMRVVPFFLGTALTLTRRTASSPILTGPAIFRRLWYWVGAGSDPPSGSVEIGWAPNVVTENNVSVNVVKPYTVLTELQDPFGAGSFGAGRGFPVWTLPNTNVEHQRDIDLIVTETRFAFTITMHNASAVGLQLMGSFTVLENVNPDALNLFTG